MAIRIVSLLIGGAVLLLGNRSVFSAELTQAEEFSLQLRKSDDYELERYGERWYGLIQLQDWTDVSGKFTVRAKYVKHDADLKSVTLLVVKGTGRGRKEKQVTVPLAKLSKACQSRVRRIAVMQPKLEEKLATFAAKNEDEEAANAGPPGFEPLVAENGAAGALSEDAASSARTQRRPADAGRQALPMRDHNTPLLPDRQAWRTNYDAFLEGIRISPSEQGEGRAQLVNLGMLARKVNTQWASGTGRGGRLGFTPQGPSDEQVGDVVWEAELREDIRPKNELKFDLKEPPKPVRLTFRLDGQLDPGDWRRFRKGDHVRFIARLGDAGPKHEIVFLVRFPDETTNVAGLPADPAGSEQGAERQNRSGENPYAGTKWIGRDRLVDDQRFGTRETDEKSADK